MGDGIEELHGITAFTFSRAWFGLSTKRERIKSDWEIRTGYHEGSSTAMERKYGATPARPRKGKGCC